MTFVRWQHTNRSTLGELLPAAIVVVPVGATEQHGPHLATGTDWILAEAVSAEAASLVHERSPRPIVLAPPVPFGASDHHLPFGGTLSLSPETLLAVLLDLARSLHADGGHRLVLVNGHGGNTGICHAAAAASTRYNLNVAHIDYWQLLPSQSPSPTPTTPAPETLPPNSPPSASPTSHGATSHGATSDGATLDGAALGGPVEDGGALGGPVEDGGALGGPVEEGRVGGVPVPGHAGEFETALMLARDPAFVAERKERLGLPSDVVVDDVGLHTAASWRRIDGYTDRPELADQATGRRWFDQLAVALGDRLLRLAEVL
ncbi:creatinine amidohydrolase/Fe(II)-dependent formamide hydrolase-like protein [Kribbella aluminosa]|uniref:Creatinine amidohydrolase/Fe(II)-dependent formamide hydrolase-like protein n=1 Tax=Kribbella aluminosa TaxID=416017 RepID=A0ABS4UYH2_9ACTN|nr:creatininase family protein [Kribbella aluminosa]MBP2356701.1 creatinine amidohydrolase/Fe(II)-dependent formamide hydrolase-like protein [Kribbella aluminosa]